MAKNIILIGFMGVGKGRTARALAARTEKYTVDTDDLIETMVKMKIRTIFAEHGEPYFRELEQQTADWLKKNVTSTIVSTGGGFFQVKNISKLGRIVYLHSSIEGILQAIMEHPKAEKKIKKRPLLQDLDQARALFKQRLPLYRKASDLEISVEGRSIDDVADELQKKIKKLQHD
ncbi:MAG: shikimate kinase [Candidatus Marinimicrobia bacterium]|nr:shikimate kinase [Desulfobulbaceae bacterium]MCF6237401.1 shikimate kinase [Candidatus Neomarinimicrobiota bacterium]